MASLGLVSPAAATDGCHLLKKSDDLFSFYPVFFLNSATKKIFRSGVTPWRMSPGAVPLPHAIPSDATASYNLIPIMLCMSDSLRCTNYSNRIRFCKLIIERKLLMSARIRCKDERCISIMSSGNKRVSPKQTFSYIEYITKTICVDCLRCSGYKPSLVLRGNNNPSYELH